MTKTHSRLSASAAARWMECPGSITITDQFGPGEEEQENDFADEGSAAHELAEKCLREGLDAWECIGEIFYGRFECDAEMAQHVQVYLDAVRASVAKGGKLVIERRLENPDLHKDFGGTVDAYVYTAHWLHNFDLKYGAGVVVNHNNNPQNRYYGYGTLNDIPEFKDAPPSKVRLVIVQPRAEHPEGPVRYETLTGQELLAWGDNELLPAMERADKESGLKLGDHCRFCPAKLVCPAMMGMFEAAVSANVADVKKMTNERLGLEMDMAKTAKMYISGVEKEAFARANKGQKVPGWKLVNKQSKRTWPETVKIDGAPRKIAALAREKFGDDAFTEPAMKSPAQLEKIVGGKAFATEYGFKPNTGYTLAPATDSKPEVTVSSPEVTVSSPEDTFSALHKAS